MRSLEGYCAAYIGASQLIYVYRLLGKSTLHMLPISRYPNTEDNILFRPSPKMCPSGPWILSWNLTATYHENSYRRNDTWPYILCNISLSRLRRSQNDLFRLRLDIASKHSVLSHVPYRHREPIWYASLGKQATIAFYVKYKNSDLYDGVRPLVSTTT